MRRTLVEARWLPAVILMGLLQTACATGTAPPPLQAQSSITGSVATPVAGSVAFECAAIEESINESVQRMANLRAQANSEAAAPATNLSDAFQRMFGPPGAGNVALEKLGRERERTVSYNADLAKRGCKPVNVDERLARAKPEAEPPGGDQAQPSEFGRPSGLPAKF